jgi:gamma-glutamylcyclotransferase (GGCT)/AIG2-like uncharacterized protein YtfP
MNVFVYGTLKSGSYNNRLLADSTLLGVGTTRERWTMLDGGFPVVLPGEDGYVVGEVYEIGHKFTLARLDRLESNGYMYQREVVDIVLSSGETIKAWMYVGLPHWRSRKHSLISPKIGCLEWQHRSERWSDQTFEEV